MEFESEEIQIAENNDEIEESNSKSISKSDKMAIMPFAAVSDYLKYWNTAHDWATTHTSDLVGVSYRYRTGLVQLSTGFVNHENWATNAIVDLRTKVQANADLVSFNHNRLNTLTDLVVSNHNTLVNHKNWATDAIVDLRSTTDYINGKVNTQRSDFTSHTTWASNAIVSLRERATDIDTKLVGHMSWATEAIEKLRTRATDIDTKLVGHMSWASDAVVSLRERANGIDKKIVEHEKWSTEAITGLRNDRDYINDKANKLRSDFNAHQTWATGAITDLRTKDSALQSDINALGTWKNVQLAWNTAQELEIGKLKGRNGVVTGDLNNQKRQGNFYASGVTNGPLSEKSWGYLVVINNFDNGSGVYQEFIPDIYPNQKFTRVWHSHFGGWSKWENLSVSKGEIDALKAKDTELSNSINSVKSLISTESTERKNADIAINSRLSTIDQEIKTINQKIDGFNWSDVGIIAAIIGIHDAWKSKDYSGPVLNDDGALVKLVKYQRDSIITSFSAVLHNIFGDPADGYLGIFWKHFDSQIYNLRYSIINGFEELKTANKAASDAIRDNQSSMLTHLETVNGWLKLLYQKPNSIIQNPFDFDRLEELLKNLKMNVNIGDTVNEAGTNIWDFLKALVKELGDVLREILDFLEKLIDTLIHLVVPKNLDFATSKFNSTGDKIKLKFSFVFGWIDTFKSLFGTTKPFEDFNLNLGGMFEGSVNVPISAINKFAPLVKTIITGFILLEFLIDMYKWFHSKGEVIE
ncbi:hypothetical protein PML78_01355 [Enterococcus dispar]|uniref:hypothetical protein n=1 Tax=Enterococcus dispar TaxID=44009 RepID=UPI00233089BE|nr:hypothetical protein [Enterococcus dispar]WCG33362.1 hypothetical protein PML78_01355 [Enterococcus dispar]